RGIPRAHRRGDSGRLESSVVRELSYRAPRLREVLVNVRAQRLQRRDVEHAHGIGERRAQTLLEQIVDGGEKRRERLARSGGRCDQGVAAVTNRRPPARLRRRRLAERGGEPPLNDRMKAGEGQTIP